MSSYKAHLYQIVFGPKLHRPVLIEDNRDLLFGYINAIARNRKCIIYKINGTEDHLHIAVDIHPSISVADFVKEVKAASTKWIKQNDIFPEFEHWQIGYGSFTHSIREKERLIKYIENQKEHHANETFRQEMIDLLKNHGVNFDMKYFW
ncbi:MAG: IS200/IS605 family transposase [Bacteroidales bacterium]|nr:IS200/IS605 family transposase [Bacteroidales bacterium]